MIYTLRFFSLQNAVCFIILIYFVPVLFTFYIQGLLKLKKRNPAKKVNMGYTVLQKRKIKLMRNALISPHFLNVQNVLI